MNDDQGIEKCECGHGGPLHLEGCPYYVATADAPAAEELISAVRYAAKKLDAEGNDGDTETAARLYRLAAHLPAMLAADADQQRMDWLSNYENAEDVFPAMEVAKRGTFVWQSSMNPPQVFATLREAIDAARSSSSPTSERPDK